MCSKTLCIIKPDVVSRGLQFEILDFIVKNKFEVELIKKAKVKEDKWKVFYEHHAEKGFFAELCEFMSSYSVYLVVLSKKSGNCIDQFRELIGTTDPQKSKLGTVRKMYGLNVSVNAVHASDSKAAFHKEMEILGLDEKARKDN